MTKFVVALLLLINSNFIFADTTKNLIIIDAGSSGTRLNLYQVDISNQAEMPNIKLQFQTSVDHGISYYYKLPEKLSSEVLDPLIFDLKKYLISSNISEANADFYLYATGGMRLLNDKLKEKLIYRTIQTYLNNNTKFNKIILKTISGDDEALYAWLDINYLENNFNNQIPDGIIELGGASFQIAYNTPIKSSDTTEITLKTGTSYNLMTLSMQGYGLNSMRSKILDLNLATSCYPKDYQITTILNGNFEQNTCSNIYLSLLNDLPTKITDNIPAKLNFIGLSGIYYNFKFFNIPDFPTNITISTNIDKICNLNWLAIEKLYPNESPYFLSNYCTNMNYTKVLLNKLLPKNDAFLPIFINQNFDAQTITWTRGVVLYLYGLKS